MQIFIILFLRTFSVPSLPPVVDGNEIDQLKHCLGDLLLAATISHVSTVPWLLESLGEQLGHLCRRFEPLVPDGLYLPAPPVYCPQPTTVDKVRGSFNLSRFLNLYFLFLREFLKL